jgi:hypothetical protein
MWEYERKDFKFRFYSDLAKWLSDKGSDGWEIVWYQEEKPGQYEIESTAKVLFKRLKNENTRTDSGDLRHT